MRILLLYSVAGSILWAAAQALGAGLGVALFLALAGPPAAHVALIIVKDR